MSDPCGPDIVPLRKKVMEEEQQVVSRFKAECLARNIGALLEELNEQDHRLER
jgi:hypothetical protein